MLMVRVVVVPVAMVHVAVVHVIVVRVVMTECTDGQKVQRTFNLTKANF